MLPPLLQREFADERPVVEAVGTPEEANALFARRSAEEVLVVLSDYDLRTVKNGADVLAEAKRARPDAVCILFSGHSREELRDMRGIEAGSFIEKPFKLRDIVAPFRAIVDAAARQRLRDRGSAPPAPSDAARAAAARDLGHEEVLSALVKAAVKGEDARTRTLFEEAERRGAQGIAERDAARALAWQNRVLDMIATNAPLADTLTMLVQAVEGQVPGAVASIRLLDATGTYLRTSAAPGLPDAYKREIDGLEVGPDAGCAAALHERRTIVASDIRVDPRWSRVRDVAAAHDLRACWCVPILSPGGRAFGTFALYHRAVREPTEGELELVELGASLAHVAIERYRSREDLRESEERFRGIVGQTIGGIAEIALDGAFRSVNDRFCEITGYGRDELLAGMRMQDITHADDAPRNLALLKRCVEEGAPFEIEKRYVRKDGTSVWVHNSVSAIRGPEGPPRSVVAICVDITERRRAEDALRQSEERYRALVTTSSDVVYRMSPDWKEMRHLQGREFIADTFEPRLTWLDVYIHPDDQPRVMAAIQEAIRTKGVFDLEHRVVRVDGTLGWTHSRAIPLLDGNGEIVEWFGTASDVTRRREAEASLRRVNQELDERVRERTKELEAINRDLESFNYVVSHDLRAPLRAMHHLIDLALDGIPPSSPEIRANLALAQRSAEDMSRLIEGLLALARVARGDIRRERIDLSEMARTVSEELRLSEPARRVEVVIQPHVVGQGDPRLLRSVLENLLGNAYKFTAARREAQIEFGTTTKDGETTYFVRDNGIGFDAREAHRLFEPFERLHTSADAPPGIGIGLATARRIVERHGGRIWATSERHEGATFAFTLPRADPRAA